MRTVLLVLALLLCAPAAHAARDDGSPQFWGKFSAGAGALIVTNLDADSPLTGMPFGRATVGVAATGKGTPRVQPIFTGTIAFMAGYIGVGFEGEIGMGLSLPTTRHRVLLLLGPVVQYARLGEGVLNRGLGGRASLSVLRRLPHRKEVGLQLRTSVIAPLPASQGRVAIFPTAEVVALF